jgi:hypothetical protein
LTEYKVPEEIPPTPIEKYIENPSIIEPKPHITDPRLLKLYAQYKKDMKERLIIHQFLQTVFSFDPDEHVRSSYTPMPENKTRKKIDTPEANRAVAAGNTIRKVKKSAAKQYEPERKSVEIKSQVQEAVYNNIPPVDTFYKLKKYADDHHEEIQEAVKQIYGAEPDLDYSMIIYKVHENKAAGMKYKEQHVDMFTSEISNIAIGRWVLLGPYKQNRERVDFYSRHTDVLKAMQEQREQDAKVANDVMKKKVQRKKKKNVEEFGPDDPAFVEWKKANPSHVEQMGAEHVTLDPNAQKVSNDKKEQIRKLIEEELADDQIEIPIHMISDGGASVKTIKVVNEAEAPATL